MFGAGSVVTKSGKYHKMKNIWWRQNLMFMLFTLSPHYQTSKWQVFVLCFWFKVSPVVMTDTAFYTVVNGLTEIKAKEWNFGDFHKSRLLVFKNLDFQSDAPLTWGKWISNQIHEGLNDGLSQTSDRELSLWTAEVLQSATMQRL